MNNILKAEKKLDSILQSIIHNRDLHVTAFIKNNFDWAKTSKFLSKKENRGKILNSKMYKEIKELRLKKIQNLTYDEFTFKHIF